MNVFRLVLCLAGLGVFLLVRQLSPPSTVKAPIPSPAAIDSSAALDTRKLTQAAASETRIALEGRMSQTNGILQVDIAGKCIVASEDSLGKRYLITTASGQVLWNNLSDADFEREEPALYSLFTAAQKSTGHHHPGLTARMRGDNRKD